MRTRLWSIGLSTLCVWVCYGQETYRIGKTDYYYSLFYVTTGKPQVKRSYTNKRDFLVSQGLKQIPKGYEIDHIIPLFEGGSDDPCNMQLLTIEEHNKKTELDRKRVRDNYSSFKYPTEEDYFESYNINNSNLYPGDTDAVYSGLDFVGRAIFRSASGRYFYFNRKGERELLLDEVESN